MHEIAIRGGMLIDGTGAPGRRQDVGIANGRIAEMAPTDGLLRKLMVENPHRLYEMRAA